MKLFHYLKRAAELLQPYSGCWAICGGVAACLYRDTPRYTGDIDFAMIDTPTKSAKDIAVEIAQGLGYKPVVGFATNQNRTLIEGPALVVGRESEDGRYVGIDFLLPVMPWIAPAVARAQSNLLDYGFAKLPTIPPEDLILAKLMAYQSSPERHKDLDDMQSILSHMQGLDLVFLRQSIREMNLEVPDQLAKLIG